jgi:hypothetical protein
MNKEYLWQLIKDYAEAKFVCGAYEEDDETISYSDILDDSCLKYNRLKAYIDKEIK